MNVKWTHAIAVALGCSGSILHFLSVNPDIANEIHVTGNVMIIAGFIVALVSEQIFGTPTPPPQAPLAAPPVAS